MGSFGAKILNNATSALAAQQAVIAATANNISNVNTAGYSRRQVELVSRNAAGNSVGIDVGDGVEVGGIKRIADEYLERLVRNTSADKSSTDIEKEFLGRIDSLFSLDGSTTTVGTALTAFFNAADDLTVNPASIELRANFLQRSQDLVESIKNTYNSLANLQTEANQRLSTEIQTVNSITAQVADLNSRIRVAEGSGAVAADERDKRDLLLGQLAEKISFSSTELSDGTVNVTLSNGFPLVSGSTSRNLEVTNNPSFAGATLPPSLGGGLLSYIVYDYDTGAGNAHIDFTQALSQQGGTIGGLLKVRGYNDPTNTTAFQADGHLVEIASRIESIARMLLGGDATNPGVNYTYLGPDLDNTALNGHQATSGDLGNGAIPPTYTQTLPYGLFTVQYDPNNFTATGLDVDGDGLPDDLGFIEGNSSYGIKNFSSILKMNFTNPRQLAAAWDLGAASGSGNYSPGDARNIKAIADLRDTVMSFSVGNHTFTGTLGEAYNATVTEVSNRKTRADVQNTVATQNLLTVQGRRDEVSGVSLDEEFANLIKFQKAFEASARMIKVAQDILDQIVNLL